jgi:hypothetical protein
MYGAQEVPPIGDGHLEEQFRLVVMDTCSEEACRVRASQPEHAGVCVSPNRFEAVNVMPPIVIKDTIPSEWRSVRQRQLNHLWRLSGFE